MYIIGTMKISNPIIIACIAFLIMSIMDGIWLTSTRALYASMVEQVQGKAFRVSVYGAIVAYTAMFISLLYLVVPMVQTALTQNPNMNVFLACLRYAGLFGFVVYAIFNATNIAIFANYNLNVAVMDIIWGTFLYTVSTYIAFLIAKG
jgi:uncharacterized membrane protein